MPTVMQWTKRLVEKIDAQTKYAEPFEKRYRNEHVLPFLAKEYAQVYPGLIVASADGRVTDSIVAGSMMSMLQVPKSGTASIVVDGLTERLALEGLTCLDDREAAEKLKQAWGDNDLDVMHHEATRESLVAARSFGSVAKETDGDRAVVGIESATQAAVIRSQRVPYDIEAYLKIWEDEWTGQRAGLLRLPGQDIDLVEGTVERRDPEGADVSSRWMVVGDPRPTGLAGVPVVEFAPSSRLLAEPRSEIDPITTAIDIIDLIEGLLVFAGHFGAVPIRYATGLDVPRDPTDPTKPLLGPNGRPMVGFNPRADHVWFGGKDAKFGQLEPAGLQSFVSWAEHAAGMLRRQTKLPSSYFSLDLKSHMSAELLKVDEAPMLRRVRRMGENGALNQSWRRLGQWILAIEMTSPNRPTVTPRWENAETRIETQLFDQLSKAVAAGLGTGVAAQKILGWDPALVDEAVAEARRAREASPIPAPAPAPAQ